MGINMKRFDGALHLTERMAERIGAFTEPAAEPGFTLRSEVTSLKELRVAALTDVFTDGSFAPECNWLQVTPDNWREELDSFKPDLFLLESAYEGKDWLWYHQVHEPSPALTALLYYCRRRGVPIIFRNKEDPFNNDLFLQAARMCDYVFTTDGDCVPKYKAALGHDRVYHLHFAAQPANQTPIETEPRAQRTFFAGSYYVRFPERNVLLWGMLKSCEEHMGVDIYDRRANEPNPRYRFPEEWTPYIRGSLPYSEMHAAYKRYRYGININTITGSSTMFARRVFELLLSNTVVVSNASKGMYRYFGDLIVGADTDDPAAVQKRIEGLEQGGYRQLRLRALRRVLSGHLYEDRLNTIVETVFGKTLKKPLPKVYVYCDGTHPDIARQALQPAEVRPLGAPLPEADDALVAVFDRGCAYGANYLQDLALTRRYSAAEGFCKPAAEAGAYRACASMDLGAGAVRAAFLRERGLLPAEGLQLTGDFIAIDEFNFARAAQGQALMEDEPLPYEGEQDPGAEAGIVKSRRLYSWGAAELQKGSISPGQTRMELSEDRLVITPDGKASEVVLRLQQKLTKEDLAGIGGLRFALQALPAEASMAEGMSNAEGRSQAPSRGGTAPAAGYTVACNFRTEEGHPVRGYTRLGADGSGTMAIPEGAVSAEIALYMSVPRDVTANRPGQEAAPEVPAAVLSRLTVDRLSGMNI